MKIHFAGLISSYNNIAEIQEVAKIFVVNNRISFLVKQMKKRGNK